MISKIIIRNRIEEEVLLSIHRSFGIKTNRLRNFSISTDVKKNVDFNSIFR